MSIYIDEVFYITADSEACEASDYEVGDVIKKDCLSWHVVVVLDTNGAKVFEEYLGRVMYRAALNDTGYCECGNVCYRGRYCSDCLNGD